MHLQWILPFTLATSSAAYLKSNQECGSNNQCSMTCKDGDFHPVAFNGTVYFACTQDDQVKYSLWSCKHIGFMDNREVCEAASGRWCACTSYCILPHNGDGFEDLCREKHTEAVNFKKDLDYGDVLSEAECRG